ncbi:hypothetical protein BP6252_05798 [Coleophoma cylindrospora]|uniref:EthD domain-containing protein n=1 Tax=Coleophoma cylindrospora TaxID=1849047 RepID=A0A3D8RUR3_9HELO|nr:hypothetical protein BP6252_05798 [Coleophoma cylindrospora]
MAPKPYLLWVNSRITSPTQVSASKFERWYDTKHIPDVFSTKMITSACRYKTIIANAESPYLTLYPFESMSMLQSKEFAAIPDEDTETFPAPSHSCYHFARFDTRVYECVDEFEKEGAKAGAATLIISAGLQPAQGTDSDFHAWYKDEHYRTLASCPGYVRTRRYKLTNAFLPDVDPPMYLALHEFESEVLPEKELAETAETEWSKRIMGNLEKQEVGCFKLAGEFSAESEEKL